MEGALDHGAGHLGHGRVVFTSPWWRGHGAVVAGAPVRLPGGVDGRCLT